eukprot:TRINITY_DN15868_c0_g1_i2.p1 TRINITY_DN15868_c0_g1~~TRINITY_DN15868_c0_g1_i2.p1  ORF type:complete len:233 (-),score=19.27 TRINITY_DN15868_c0_g1_i2:200-898(-)
MHLDLNQPRGICIDSKKNIYIADHSNHAIKKLSSSTWSCIGTNLTYKYPEMCTLDHKGNLLVSDTGNNRIVKIAPDGKASVMTTFIASPSGICVSKTGSIYVVSGKAVYETEEGGYQRKVIGDLLYPRGIALDDNEDLMVCDMRSIKRVSKQGEVSVVAGCALGYSDGPGNEARFDGAIGIAMDHLGTIYVTDCENNRIRIVSRTDEIVLHWPRNHLSLPLEYVSILLCVID